MSVDINIMQAQLDAANRRRQMMQAMAQQLGQPEQQQVVNGRVMDQGFAPAIRAISSLIAQGRAGAADRQATDLQANVGLAKQRQSQEALAALLGGDQPSTAPQAQGPQMSQAPQGETVGGMLGAPPSVPQSAPQGLPPTVATPMDSFLPNLRKAAAAIQAGAPQPIVDAWLKQNSIENKPDAQADYTIGDTRYSGKTNQPIATNPKEPTLSTTADGLLFDGTHYRDPDGKVMTASQVRDWKINLAKDRSAAVTATKPNSAFDTEDGALLAAFAERGITLPAGLRSKEQQVSTLHGLRTRNAGLTPDEIADKVAKGQIGFGAEKKETTTAAGQAGKIAVAQNEVKQFAPLVLQASAAVPRGQFVPYNKLMQTADSAISDPALLTFKTQMTALNNAYDSLAARGGTDMNKREHIHQLFNTANSPEAVQALVQAIQQEAAAAEKAAEDATKPRNQSKQTAAERAKSMGL